MPETAPTDPILALVLEGWDHLRRQRPLAAWASWRRALRLEPEHEAATHALHVLANAGDLPLAARVEYRFLTPLDDATRSRWDARFRGGDLEQLADAAETFAELAEGDPLDTRARFNQGLCLAWLGRNLEAVEALDRTVRRTAELESHLAVDAWSLAEVLRQGGGAEALADDRNHVATIAWTPGDDPAGFLDDRPDVRVLPHPVDPVTGLPQLSRARLYEWLDRPPLVGSPSNTLADLRRVRANVVRLPESLRLSGTDPSWLEAAIAEVDRAAARRVGSVERQVTPLPLAFLDADVWAIRMPPGLLDDDRARLNRSAVERYYEVAWIARTRQGLDGRTPAEAAQLAGQGDHVARAKLEAVVRIREQLGMRPSTALLYQGYPFDRLRRRLGLPPSDPDAIDPTDAASMSGPELDQLDPDALDDYTLAEAYESAAALGDDRRTARFAAVLAAGDPSRLADFDLRALFATLIRRELLDDSTDGALEQIDRAQAVDLALNQGRDRRTYETWRAEVHVRVGQPDRAVLVYRGLAQGPPDPTLALEAAEMLLDAGFEGEAREMAQLALDLGEPEGDDEIIERAKAFLL